MYCKIIKKRIYKVVLLQSAYKTYLLYFDRTVRAEIKKIKLSI